MNAIGPSQTGPDQESGVSPFSMGNVRVLILEDNPFDSELMEFELKENGINFEARRVESEQPYRRALREFCPDLILSDYDLPQFNGFQALQIAKESCPDAPFILVTGAVGEDRAIEVLTGGATDYVLKSRISRLAPAVRRALQENYEHRKRRQAESERDALFREMESRVRERTENLQAEIEKRRQTEERLREAMKKLDQSRSELNRAQSVSRTGSWHVDIEKQELRWSDETYRIFGLPPDTRIFLENFLSFVHPEDRQQVYRAWQKALNGEPYDVEHRAIVNGEVRWIRERAELEFDAQGAMVNAVGTAQDITDLKRNENALRESEAQFRAIFDLSGIGTGLTDTAGTLLRVNDAFLKMTGFGRDELIGRPLIELAHPDDAALKGGDFFSLLRGERDIYETEKRLIRKDGKIIWCLSVDVLIRDSYGKPLRVVVALHDITERKRTETILMEKEERFRLAQQAGKVGVFDWALDKDECIVSEELADMYGFPDNYRPSGRDWMHSVHPDDRKQARAKVQQAFREERRELEDEYRIVLKDGRVKWLLNHSLIYYESGKPVRMIGTSVDVTERKEAEIALRHAEEQLRLAVESTELGTFDMDPRTYRLDWSRHSKLQFGLPPHAEVDYDTFLSGIHPDDRERIGSLLQKLLRGEAGGYYSTEFRTIGIQDRKVRWLASWGRVFFNEEGQAVRFIGVSADITELKRTEQNLQKRRAELEYLNRELESFSYSVSHDLRAPLRAIKGYAGIIMSQYGPSMQGDIRDKFGRILDNAARMEELIKDLLRLSRLGREKLGRSDLDMKALALETWEEIMQLSAKKIELRVLDPAPACGDRNLIKQVLVNILSNALKFTRPRQQPLIEFGGSGTEEENVYFVRDNGVGFDMQYSSRLFGVFQRLHGAEYEGTGVGLAIVQRIIRRHGGKVWAESEVDRGSTFYFSLPRRKKYSDDPAAQ